MQCLLGQEIAATSVFLNMHLLLHMAKKNSS